MISRNPIPFGLLLSVLAAMASPAVAQETTDARPGGEPLGEPLTRLRVIDLTPRFLAFYGAARERGADEAERWVLWKEHYDFAAVPPVPERDSLARAMLAEAWPRYPGLMERIRQGGDGLRPPPEQLLARVAARLDAHQPVTVQLLLFVGDGRSGAFFTAADGNATVAVPIEEAPDRRRRGMAHEFTHAVHNQLAGLSGEWERTVAQTLFTEGLAMRMEEALFPGLPAADYVSEHRPGWFQDARAAEDEILQGLRPHLRDDSSAQVARFTIEEGATGLRREAYYAGWVVVGHLLDQGRTLAELARVPESRIPDLVESAIHSVGEDQ